MEYAMTLRCTIEIVPFGIEDRKRPITVLNISNLGHVSDCRCAYWVETEDHRGVYPVKHSFPLKQTHDRRDGAEELVRKVIEELV
jgi:hypothetical protein